MSCNRPIESKEFPGFYEIPEFSRYVISREGKIIEKETSKVVEPKFIDSYGLMILNRDTGKKTIRGRHRLLGIVFFHPGCAIDNLIVNHLNGVPGDDRLENLEWTTYKGNLEHAGKMGLTSKCIPISVRDVKTGEVQNYPSIVEYARLVGWSKDKVNWRIRIGEGRVFPEGKQYRPANIITPWYIPEDLDLAILQNGRPTVTLIKDVLTGKVTEYHSLSEASRQLGISKAALSIWITFRDMPVLRGFIQAKFAHDPRPWRPVSDPYLEIEMTTGTRAVKVTEDNTDEVYIFPSLVECAQAMGLKPTALGYRLKSKGDTVFSDGRRYAYYSDTI